MKEIDYWSKSLNEACFSFNCLSTYLKYMMQNSPSEFILDPETSTRLKNFSATQMIIVKTAYENKWTNDQLLRTIIEFRARIQNPNNGLMNGNIDNYLDK